MADVYVLIETYPYEFSEVVGVYALELDAEWAKTECLMFDNTCGYNDFDIELHHIK